MSKHVHEEPKRDHQWLEDQLELIWQNHFADVERLNTVTIRWGRAARTRLGTITGRKGTVQAPTYSEIRINPLLQDEKIPKAVVWQTIAHEVAHYCHGFCSPHPRKYDHPHRGNVIEKELFEREFAAVYNEAQAWLKQHWATHVASTIATPQMRRKRRRTYGQRPNTVSLLSNIRKIVIRRNRLGNR